MLSLTWRINAIAAVVSYVYTDINVINAISRWYWRLLPMTPVGENVPAIHHNDICERA